MDAKTARKASKREVQRRERAVYALLTQKTEKAAAKVVGVSTKTLQRWMAEPEFEKLYKAAADAAFKVAMRRVRGIAARMVSTLETIAANPKAPAAARVTDALGTLRIAQDQEALENIEAGLRDMEDEHSEPIP
jgi:hypothetical protein